MKARSFNPDYRSAVRATVSALALFLCLGSYGWAATVLDEDFEDDALGALNADWTISSAGRGKVSIVNTTDHGHVLQLQGSKTTGEFLIAIRAVSSSSTDLTTQVDIKPSTASSFIWTINGAGSSIGRRRIRLQQAPGSTALVANTVPSGDTTCGSLPANAWSTVTLTIDTVSGTFDVSINGAPTSCTGITAGIQPPFNSVNVMDASNQNWGGTVLFDNMSVETP